MMGEVEIMFEGEDCHTLQTLVDNGTISPGAQYTTIQVQNVIQTTIKGEQFWNFRDEILTDVRQKPEEVIHIISKE